MTWLVLAGVAIYLLTRGGRRAPVPAPSSALPLAAQAARTAAVAPVPPPPPQPGRAATVTMITETPAGPAPGGGSIIPPSIINLEPTERIDIPIASIPPALLAVVQQGSSANETELLAAAEESRLLGRTDLYNYFMGRVQARRQASRTWAVEEETVDGVPMSPQRQLTMTEREVPQPPRTVPGVPTASVQPSELPTARATREELFQLAQRVADSIRRSGNRAYDRALLKTFQRKAGLQVDGDYGRQSAQALGHYGRFPAGQVPAPQY